VEAKGCCRREREEAQAAPPQPDCQNYLHEIDRKGLSSLNYYERGSKVTGLLIGPKEFHPEFQVVHLERDHDFQKRISECNNGIHR
jgi:hypothetical protein